MTDEHPEQEPPIAPGQEPWKTVYLGQIAADLVPFHPDPPEAREDELTEAALADPGNVNQPQAHEAAGPTLWRLMAVLLVAVVALGIVFWFK